MSTIAQNLTALQNAKAAIACAITEKGGTLGAGDGFADFASAILGIPTTSDDPGSGGIVLPTLTTPAAADEILSGKEAIAADGTLLTGTLQMRHGRIFLENNLRSMTMQLIQHNLGVIPKIIFATKTSDAVKRPSNVAWALYFSVFGLQENSGTIYSVTDANMLPSIQQSSSNRIALAMNASSFQFGMTDSAYSWAGQEYVDWWVFA